MISEQEKYEALKRILNSKTFSKSTTSNVLLKFLVESSIQESEISASDIGREIFGKQYQHEKSEATIRVNVYHLRKKLIKYYEGEGKRDVLRISIERGQYRVKFEVSSLEKRKNRRLWIYSLIAVVLLAGSGIGIYLSNRTSDKVWTEIFNNNHPTSLYLSPLFFYISSNPLGDGVFMRNLNINSEEQLQAILKDKPDVKGKYRPLPPLYITFEDASTIKPFTQHFVKNKSDFSLHKATDFSLSEIKDINLISLGPMRYETKFTGLFNELSHNVKLRKVTGHDLLTIQYKSIYSDMDTTIYLHSGGKNYEHAIVAKLKGSNETSCLMFFADHGLGALALSEYFTDSESLENFSKNYVRYTEEFVAVFYVSGKERTNLNLELLHFDSNN